MLPSKLIEIDSYYSKHLTDLPFVYRAPFQMLWILVICSVEELCFENAAATFPAAGLTKRTLYFMRIFTMSLQSMIGILAYVIMISVSLIHSRIFYFYSIIKI